ncbi:MAG: NTP transferase domain-containing protein [Deltaproteobacteria bacterium]|nr:NTP transferase domain-containing protein [Deltaproteobacteria bacterium]
MNLKASSCHVLILAAGFSSRMGRFKPLMRLGGKTLLQRLVALYRKAGLSGISVVCGYKADAVQSAAEELGVNRVINPRPEEGMFSSIQTGISALAEQSPTVSGLFVHPVDIPLVRPDTVLLVLRAAERCGGPLLIPAYAGNPGHPPLIDAELFPYILKHDGRGGLQAVLSAHDPEIVPVADRNILFDLDEPGDYLKAARVVAGGEEISGEEAEQLLLLYFQPPPALYAHCRAVAEVTGAMLEALASAGVTLDRDLALSGAWLHDLAKGEPKHAVLGGRRLKAMGFPRLARVVALHNECRWPEDIPLDEAAVVALADKLVAGVKRVGLEERFGARLAEYGGDMRAERAIKERLSGIRRLAGRFERAAGKSLDFILRRAVH